MPVSRTATARVAAAIQEGLERNRSQLGSGPLVLAVSGGADSLAMLLAAASIGDRKGYSRPQLVAAHFSHGLRPDAEPSEAELVRGVADKLSVPMVHERATVAPSEAAAREARYAFLTSVARAYGACAVATAHTQDDQAETLLLRLVRGTGSRGAGAIRELSSREINGTRLMLLRPLLSVSRADTEAVCHEAGVIPAKDITNSSLRYARNRLRLRVLPELARLNPEVRTALVHHAEAVQADEDLLELMARDAVREAESWTDRSVRWPRATLAGLPGPLVVRVLQAAWRRLAGEGAALAYAKLRAAQQLLVNNSGGQLDLGGVFMFVVEQDWCRMERGAPSTPLAKQALHVPGVTLVNGWRITSELLDATPDMHLAADVWEAALDADQAMAPLCVRGRRPGDRLHPLGMGQAAKLQDVLVNARVPRKEREGWPLVVSPRGIAWVPGVRIAEWAKVTGATRRILWLRAKRPG